VPRPGRLPRVAGAARGRSVVQAAAADAPSTDPPISLTPSSPGPAGPPQAGPLPGRDVEPAGVLGLLVVGRVGKPQGIRGEVTVEVRTDDPEARFAPGAVLITDPTDRGPLTVAAARDQNGRLVVLFGGIADRNGAEALRNILLLVDSATLPPPADPDEFHDFQLVGLLVELPGGDRLGTVSEVLHLPHGDVLAVRRDGVAVGAPEVLVPFVHAMVPVVDVAGGRLVVDPPPGLLDLSEPELLGPEPPPDGG